MESRILYTPRMRRRKKRISRRSVFAALGFIAVLGVLGGAVYLLRYPAWQITEMSFSGFERVVSVDVEAKIQEDLRGSRALVLPRSSYFLFDSAESEEKILKDFPRLESIQIRKEFPSKISVVAKEREFWAIYCAGESGRCGYSDRTGFVYEEAPVSTGSLILTVFRDTGNVEIPSQSIEQSLVEKLILFSELLSSETGEKKRGLEYVDLRFGNKIFYKTKNP